MQKKYKKWRVEEWSLDSLRYQESLTVPQNSKYQAYGPKVAHYTRSDTFRETMRELVRSPVPQGAALVRHLVQQIALAGRLEERVSLVRMFAEQVVADNPSLDEGLRLKLRYLCFDDQIANYVSDTSGLTAEFAADILQKTGGGSKLPFQVISHIYGSKKSNQLNQINKINLYTKLDWMRDNFVFFNNAQRESYGALFNSKKQLMLLAYKRLSDKIKHLKQITNLYIQIYTAERQRLETLEKKLQHTISLEQKYIDLYQKYTETVSLIRLKRLGAKKRSVKAQELLQRVDGLNLRTQFLKRRLNSLIELQGFIQAFRSKKQVYYSLLATLKDLYKKSETAQMMRLAALQAQFQ